MQFSWSIYNAFYLYLFFSFEQHPHYATVLSFLLTYFIILTHSRILHSLFILYFFFTIFCISFLSICISCERMWNKLYWIFMMINLYICFIIFIIIVALVCFLSLLYSLSHYVTLLSVLSMFLFVIGSGGPWYDVKATFQMWISYESKYNKNESRCRWRMFW